MIGGEESDCLEEGFDAATRVGETGGSSSGAGRRRCAHLATGAETRGNVDVGDDGCHGSGDDASVRVDRRGGRCVIIIEDWRRYQSSFCEAARQLQAPLIALRRVGGVTVGFARCHRGVRSVAAFRSTAARGSRGGHARARCRPSEAAGARRRRHARAGRNPTTFPAISD